MNLTTLIWWAAIILIIVIGIYLVYSLPRNCLDALCSATGISRNKLIWGVLGLILVIALIIALTQVPEGYQIELPPQFLEKLAANQPELPQNDPDQTDLNQVIRPAQIEESPSPNSNLPLVAPVYSVKSRYNPLYDPEKAHSPYTVTILRKNKISAGERACKRAAEKIFGKPFESVHISWLINPETRYHLEIDCYNDDLKIGIEYHGEQHYRPDHHFHQVADARNTRFTQNSYTRSVNRDLAKVDLCDTYGVYLITVPYRTPISEIENLIRYYHPQKRLERLQRGLTE